MTRLSWAQSSLLALSLGALACGGDDPKKTQPIDAGTGGASAEAGTGGSGGGPGDGGSPGAGGADAGVPDTTAPTFSGATAAAGLTEDRVRVTWEAADDDQTPAPQIAYRVYRASTGGGQDFSRGRRCGSSVPDAGPTEQATLPCYWTTAAGATSAVVIDALPAHTYHYVVRAVDAAGNEDANTQEVSATTDDLTGPEFGGVDAVSIVSAFSIRVQWGAAYDRSTTDSNLVFEVFVQKDGDPAPTAPTYTSAPGEHTTIIGGLEPRTKYVVWVKAVDPTGNIGGGEFSLGVTTPEGIPPTFGGALRANVDGRTVQILWPPATDNSTDYQSIVYDVYSYQASTPQCLHREDFTKPPRATSIAGASSVTFDEPEEGTRYCYVVRARDVAGNSDSNTREVSVITEVEDTRAPTFNGLTTVTSESPTSIKLTWSSANDDSTTSTQFVYDVFLGTAPSVALGTPAARIRGATTITIGGLTPATTYYAVVRATDRAGHPDESSPRVERSGATGAASADTTAPTSSGTITASMVLSPPTDLAVSWGAAVDETSLDSGIRYHVCVSLVAGDCTGTDFFKHVALTTARGETSGTLRFLTPRTPYSIVVRAEDEAGNTEPAGRAAQSITATSWATNVLPLIAGRCYACHDRYDKAGNITNAFGSMYDDGACGPGGHSREPTEAGAGCRLKLVDPGRPEYSIIFRKVNPADLKLDPFSAGTPNRYDGLQMPRDSTGQLDAEQIDSLLDWIRQGAIAN